MPLPAPLLAAAGRTGSSAVTVFAGRAPRGRTAFLRAMGIGMLAERHRTGAGRAPRPPARMDRLEHGARRRPAGARRRVRLPRRRLRPTRLAAVEATQSGELVFAAALEVVLLGTALPSPVAWGAMALIIAGIAGYVIGDRRA
jgi:hypothetical protein